MTNEQASSTSVIEKETILKAYQLIHTAKNLAQLYEKNPDTFKHISSTKQGNEIVQIAASLYLYPYDFLVPDQGNEAMLLSIGITPYQLLLHALVKAETGGLNYYGGFSLKEEFAPFIPFPNNQYGAHVIPATGIAQGIDYSLRNKLAFAHPTSFVLCSLSDNLTKEGEVYEALQAAVTHNLPIMYLIQDNGSTSETHDIAGSFKEIEKIHITGDDFIQIYQSLDTAIKYVRGVRKPVIVYVQYPKNHKEKFDNSLQSLEKALLAEGESEETIENIKQGISQEIQQAYEQATQSNEPEAYLLNLFDQLFQETMPAAGQRAAFPERMITFEEAIKEGWEHVLSNHHEATFYGQAIPTLSNATSNDGIFEYLNEKFGADRIFTYEQAAYIIGSAAGISITQCRPIATIASNSLLTKGFYQLAETISKNAFLTSEKYALPLVLRVPVGAHQTGGHFYSGSVESLLLQLKGIKIVYPSTAADMKGLINAAFEDMYPVILLEHRGLYHLEEASSPAPDELYSIPIGQAKIVQEATAENIEMGSSMLIITYGMGVYWAKQASRNFEGCVEILDLRSLQPLDFEAIIHSVERHGKVLLLTEEPLQNSFVEAIGLRITQACFQKMDAPVYALGSEALPAIPLHENLVQAMLPTVEKVKNQIEELLNY